MSETRITIQLEQPKPMTREEREKQRYDYLMDKAEYATDCFLSGIRKEEALRMLRRMWDYFESIDQLPEYLRPIKQFIEPTIRQYGSNYASDGE